MICQSCGANSSDEVTCEYCSSRIKQVDTTDVLIQEESRKAQLLDLDGELSYIYQDKEDGDQILNRLIKKSREYLGIGKIKHAEFLSQLAIKSHPANEEVLIINASVMTAFAIKTSGSVQMANIKKKYIADAKKILDKGDYASFKNEAEEIYAKLDHLDGNKASAFTTQGDVNFNSQGNANDPNEAVPGFEENGGKALEGCATFIGWIFAALIVIGIFI